MMLLRSARISLCLVFAIGLHGCTQPEVSSEPVVPLPVQNTVSVPKPIKRIDQPAQPTSKKLSPELEALFHPKPSGLSIEQQRKMFYEKAESENKNERELDRLYPLAQLENVPVSASSQKFVLGRAAYSAKQDDRLYDRIMKKYHLTYGQMCEINGRGVQEKWPLPPGSGQ